MWPSLYWGAADMLGSIEKLCLRWKRSLRIECTQNEDSIPPIDCPLKLAFRVSFRIDNAAFARQWWGYGQSDAVCIT